VSRGVILKGNSVHDYGLTMKELLNGCDLDTTKFITYVGQSP
jgi:hypothetical protein